MTLEATGLRDMPDDLIRELYIATGPLYAEVLPDVPRHSLEQRLTQVRNLPGGYDGTTIVARDGAGQIVGCADVGVEDREGARRIADVNIRVLPGHRRTGIGRTLLRPAIEAAERYGRNLLTSRTRETVPAGEAFARRIGAGLGQVMLENRLDLHAVDRDLVRSWVEAGPVRAPGYHLTFIIGLTPDQLLPAAAAAYEFLNTAPRDDLQVGDFALTPEQLKEQEQAAAAAGMRRWVCYAVDDATGDFVGLTTISFSPAQHELIRIFNTAVDPAHRGHALGKWLKGAMTQRVLDELPAARWLITRNAASNDAMLSINRQLGFVACVTEKKWQVSTERVRAYLSGQA